MNEVDAIEYVKAAKRKKDLKNQKYTHVFLPVLNFWRQLGNIVVLADPEKMRVNEIRFQ